MFFSCYAFILGQEIVKHKITVDQLKSVFSDPPPDNGIRKDQHDLYIDKIHRIYCENRGKFSFDAKAPQPKDYRRYEFNRKPILSGPIFMTKIFELNFESYSKDEKSEKSGTYVDFSNAGFLEIGNTKELDFEKGGCKHAAILFVFCAAAERALLEKKCCSPSAKIEEIVRNAQDVSNILSREAIMPNIQEILNEFSGKLIEAIRTQKNGPMTRFQGNGLSNDIQAFIVDEPSREPDSIYECRSLHIVIPNESRSFPESVIELKFHFFDIKKQELSFHYIESYDCKDQSGKLSDGYYFMPGSDNSLPESDYLSCDVKIGTVLDPGDETTAHVVAVLYKP